MNRAQLPVCIQTILGFVPSRMGVVYAVLFLCFFGFVPYAHAVSITGTVYSDAGATPSTVSRTIKLAIGTSTVSIHSTTTDSGAATWHFLVPAGDTITASTPVVVWVDGDASFNASVFTKFRASGADVDGLNLYQNRVIVRNESTTMSTSTRTVDMAFYDSDDDSDIKYNASSTAWTFNVLTNNELYIWKNSQFYASGTVTVNGNASSTSATDGSMYIAGTYVPSATTTLGGSLTASTSATIYPNPQGIVLNATTTGKYIHHYQATGTPTLGNLTFSGAGGAWEFGTDNATTTNLTIGSGATVTAPMGNLTIKGNFTQSGEFRNNSGTVIADGYGSTFSGTFTGTSSLASLALRDRAVESFATAYDSSESSVYALIVDNTNRVLYAGTLANGIIYRCALSTNCDAAGDFTTALDASESYILSFAIDTANGILYAGSGSGGVIYRCALSTGCDETSDFTTAYDTADWYIYTLTIDAVNGVLYAGSGQTGIVFRCVLSTNCDAAGDFTTAYDTAGTPIYDLEIDAANGVLYVGTNGSGIIYRCVLSTNCDESSDFTTAYNTPKVSINALAIDTARGVLYAGTDSGAVIYRCVLSTGCDASGDFTTAYTLTEAQVYTLTIDTANDILYAGTYSGGIIYRCMLSTGCDASGDFTTAYDTSVTGIKTFAADPMYGVLYAGTDTGGIVYRYTPSGVDNVTLSNNASTTNFTIGTYATATMAASTALEVRGAFANTGTFTAGTGGTLYLTGASTTLSGSFTGSSALGTAIISGASRFGTTSTSSLFGAAITDPTSLSDSAQGVVVDDTYLYVTGVCNGCGSLGSSAYYTVKYLKSTGAQVWATTTDPTVSMDSATTITQDDTYLYIAGVTDLYADFSDYAFYTVKYLKSTGAQVWATTTNPSVYDYGADSVVKIIQDASYVYVTGSCTGCGALGDYAYYTVKYLKSTGAQVWATTTDPTSGADTASAITQDDTHLYVTGFCTGCGALGNTANYTVKYLKSTGAQVWATTTDPTSGADTANSITQDDTHLYVTGYCTGCGASGNHAYYTVKYLKSTGAQVWAATTDPTASVDESKSIAIDDAYLYVTGSCTGCGSLGNTAYYTVKYLKSTGAQVWATTTDPTASADSPIDVAHDDTYLYVTGSCTGCGSLGSSAYYTVKYLKSTGAVVNGDNTATFVANASTTGNFTIANGGSTATNTVIAPAALTVTGSYANGGIFTNNGGVVHFASTSAAQDLWGTLTGSSAFNTLRFAGPTTTRPTSGLVGEWLFSEGTSTATADTSGYGKTGTLTNGPVWTTAGKSGNGLSFDGVDDYISVSSTFGLSNASLSIALWTYIPSTSDSGAFIKIGGGSDGFALGVGSGTFDSPGNALIGLYEGVAWKNSGANIGTGWNHVVMVINADKTPTFYINGASAGSLAASTGVSPTGGTTYIGAGGSGGRRFTGKLDDVRVYNRALTAADVALIYGHANRTFSSNASTTNLYVDSGVVVAPTLLSIAGNYTNNGTYVAGAGTTTFNGSSAQAISGTMVDTSAYMSTAFTGAGTKTLSNNASTTHLVIDSGSTVVAPAALTIAGNYTNNGTFTNNGGSVQFSSTTAAQEISGNLTGTSAFGSLSFVGTDLGRTGLVGEWLLNEGSGLSTVDTSGYGRNGTLTNGPTWTSGKTGNGVNFDGSDDQVVVPSTFGLGNASFTMTMWVYIPSTSDHGAFLKIGGNDGFAIGVGSGTFESNGNVLIGLYETIAWKSTGASLGTGWKHVAMVVNADRTSTYYVDGVSVGSLAASTGVAPTGGYSYIGGYGGGGTRQFTGKIDDVRVYNAVLSGADILAIYSQKVKTFGANASTTNFTVNSGVVTAPTLLDISGNYANSAIFLNNGGTTTFSGTSAQTISGIATGTSPFAGVVLTGAGTKTFSSAASTTNLYIETTATTTFSAPLSVTGTLRVATSSAKLALAASATSTVSRLEITGTEGNEVRLRSSTPDTKAGLSLTGTASVTYADIKDSSATSTAGNLTATDSVDSGNNNGWTILAIIGTAAISSGANQTFALNYPTTTISTITITDDTYPAITAANDIRIAIATSSVGMKWDTTDTTATFGGTAAAKVSNPVSYAADGAVLVIPVDTNFSAGETLTIDGLAFAQFTATNTAASALGVATDGTGTTTPTDDKTVIVTGSLTVADHGQDQITDNFQFPSDTAVELFRYTMAPLGEEMTVSATAFTLTGVNGVNQNDLSNLALYRDINANGTYDAGTDTQVGGAGALSISGQSGTITFSAAYSATTSLEYILIGDIANIRPGDQLTIALAPTGVTASGDLTLGTVLPVGGVAQVQHIKNGQGAVSTHAEVGGDAPAGAGVVAGGGQGGGDEVDTNTNGDVLGDMVGYRAPTSNGGSWTSGASGYNSDGVYTTSAVADATHLYMPYDFNVPGNNTITGIEVKLEGSGTTAAGEIQVKIGWNHEGGYTEAKTTGTLTATDAVYTLGGNGDTWGHSWVPAEVGNDSFIVQVIAQPSGNTVKIDAIRVRVYHQATGGGQGGGVEVRRKSDRYFAAAPMGLVAGVEFLEENRAGLLNTLDALEVLLLKLRSEYSVQ